MALRLVAALLLAALAAEGKPTADSDDPDPTPSPTRMPTPAPTRPPGCRLTEESACQDGRTWLLNREACEPKCEQGTLPLGPRVCLAHGKEPGVVTGPGCVVAASLPPLPHSDIDAVPDATSMDDMVFKNFKLVNISSCLLFPGLPGKVKGFIKEQAGKYGPSKSAIRAHKHLGQAIKSEFFLNIEQVSILLAQLLCGATTPAPPYKDGPQGAGDHPQAFGFGRAMEHWYLDDAGEPRPEAWRRSTLVGYGTFDNAQNEPTADSTVNSPDLSITAGCGARDVADWGVGDTDTMTVVFAGHYLGGWMTGWHKANTYGAQEEKFGTLIPEMMLATEPLRQMGAGLLSSGHEDPWLPQGGWYIIGAGAYVKSKGYPKWTADKIPITEDDYFTVGTGRRIRRRGLVAIMAKPCNDRGPGSCGTNTDSAEYKCYNRQVKDDDMSPSAANLWGIAAGAFDFTNWPSKTRRLMQSQGAAKKWVLQAGGWGAGAFGCGTLYNGLVQALAAKQGGWESLRMCYATRDDPTPTIESKLGFVLGTNKTLAPMKVLHADTYKPLFTHIRGAESSHHHAHHDAVQEDFEQVVASAHHGAPPHGAPPHGAHGGAHHAPAPAPHHDPFAPSPSSLKIPAALVFPAGGKFVFSNSQFGGVAGQLHKEIEQKIIPPVCTNSGQEDVNILDRAPLVKCNKPGARGTCISNMAWCCSHPEACKDWSRDTEDLRDFAGRSCNALCSKAAKICKADDVPESCQLEVPKEKPQRKKPDEEVAGPTGEESTQAEDFRSPSEEYNLRGQQALHLFAQDSYSSEDMESEQPIIGDSPTDSRSKHGLPGWALGLGLVGVGGLFIVGGVFILGAGCFGGGRKRTSRAVRVRKGKREAAAGEDALE